MGNKYDPEDGIDSVECDTESGLVIYKGQTMTLRDLLTEWESEDSDYADRLNELRDTRSDRQNLWGTKKNRFRDNWRGKFKPLRRGKGYPSDNGYEKPY